MFYIDIYYESYQNIIAQNFTALGFILIGIYTPCGTSNNKIIL